MCFPSIAAVDTDSEGNGILKKDILQRNVEKIFLNVWAFTCIVFGYIMSIFTSNDMEYLLERNYFESGGCSRPFLDGETHDTICYHSYTVFAFTS